MATRVETRQVFEMPEPQLEVTEHRASIYTCACCRGVTRAAFPDEVTAHVQYGPRIRAAVIFLGAQHLIPEERVGEIMHDLFGAASLCPASIAAWSAHKAEDLARVVAQIAAWIAGAAVRHLDETGFRIGGRTRWLHTVSTAALTQYRVSEKRGAMPATLRDGVIVRRGLAFHEAQPPLARRPGARGRTPKRVGHNLLERLRVYKTEVLRFVSDFAVPFSRVDDWRGSRRLRGSAVDRRLSPLPVSQFAP